MSGDDNESCQLGFQHCAEMMLNCPSSGTNTRPFPEKIEPMSMSSAYGCSNWDPIVSLNQNGGFGGLTKSSSYPLLLETQGISSSSHLVNYPLDPSLTQMIPKLTMFGGGGGGGSGGGGSYPEIGNLFGIHGGIQNPNVPFPQSYESNKTRADEKSCVNVQVEKERQIREGRVVGVSQDGRRKRDYNSTCPPNKNGEGDYQKDQSSENSGAKEQEDKRQKTEQNASRNSCGKQADKQVKDDSECEEAPKDYIHMRARRGQATNSHSLAERVRREKISERMRLLQELVPGCNKITGKAVMLDEIINYVQSLQQQVEFLSMKLATVNPDVNFDIEQLLSKDILHSRVSGVPVLGYDQGMHGFPHSFHQGSLGNLSIPTSQYAAWNNNDLQNLLHMGFDPNPSAANLGPNGNSKTEL